MQSVWLALICLKINYVAVGGGAKSLWANSFSHFVKRIPLFQLKLTAAVNHLGGE